ncbi:MAG: sigma-54-dependent Fis family transcriptional regulator [Nannocystaceae bacterium]|nr:sigma-54-dependent Fis family transcriptional regulator [Nannocystaceae bacterium]
MESSQSWSGRVLVVDDDADLCSLLVAGLAAQGFTVDARQNAEAGLAALIEVEYDVVLADLNLPGMSGLEFCAKLAAERPELTVIVMTAFASMRSAIEAIRAGAYDYIEKPLSVEGVGLRVTRIVRECRIRDEAARLRELVAPTTGFGGLSGTSSAMRKVYDLLARTAATDASVLITGESGSGKELAARALHDHGPRREGPFVAVNCSAVPEQLLESELFGHTRGAFTDARNDRVGLFVQAHGGTLFLDEIGEIPLAMQPKLLRALEERCVRPVGANKEVAFDVRVIAASNRDLEAAVEEGRFREDLFFRVNVIGVQLPPLRNRGTDVLVLAQQFISRFATANAKTVNGLTALAAQRMCDYDWPGNVRELRNSIERAVALVRGEEIDLADLPERIRTHHRNHVVIAADPATLVPLEEVERRYIARVVEAVGGNKTLASKILGLDRKTLYRKLERYRAAGDGA